MTHEPALIRVLLSQLALLHWLACPQARDLGLQLASARAQLESYRQQLESRNRPDEVLVGECRRLQVQLAWAHGIPTALHPTCIIHHQ